MQLEIITPEKKIYSGTITSVQLPGSQGSFAILNHHAPIIATLEKGKIKVVEQNGRTLYFDIEGGVVENKNNTIIVLTEPSLATEPIN